MPPLQHYEMVIKFLFVILETAINQICHIFGNFFRFCALLVRTVCYNPLRITLKKQWVRFDGISGVLFAGNGTSIFNRGRGATVKGKEVCFGARAFCIGENSS